MYTSISSHEDSLPITEEATAMPSRESDSSDITGDSTDVTSYLIGIFGEVFDPASFEERPDYVLNVFQYYRTDYGYTALFDGKTYNSYDNPEKFEDWECTEQCEAASGGLFIVNKGDNIGGLTCTDAYAEYYIDADKKSPLNPSFGLMSSSVCFDGEIEVTGYIDRFSGDDGYVDDGELYFYPDESWQGLPIPYADNYYQTYSMNDGSLVYTPFRLSLGVVYDYSALDLEHIIPGLYGAYEVCSQGCTAQICQR